jgi:hypothetical protein
MIFSRPNTKRRDLIKGKKDLLCPRLLPDCDSIAPTVKAERVFWCVLSEKIGAYLVFAD